MSMATTLNAVAVTMSVAGRLRACGCPGGQAVISQRGREQDGGPRRTGPAVPTGPRGRPDPVMENRFPVLGYAGSITGCSALGARSIQRDYKSRKIGALEHFSRGLPGSGTCSFVA
jgi:hypothetical protein